MGPLGDLPNHTSAAGSGNFTTTSQGLPSGLGFLATCADDYIVHSARAESLVVGLVKKSLFQHDLYVTQGMGRPKTRAVNMVRNRGFSVDSPSAWWQARQPVWDAVGPE